MIRFINVSHQLRQRAGIGSNRGSTEDFGFFDRKTVRLFGDVNYKVLTAKGGRKYLVRLTAQLV